MEVYYQVILYVMTGILGLCVGSFLNVVIYRVPLGMSLAKPPSTCPKCGYTLKWYDNIPVLSYIILGGRCRKCKERISFRYTAVEVGNTVLWLLSVWMFWEKSITFAVISALALSVLVVVFFIDLEHKLVFDRFVIILTALGIVSIFFDPYFAWYSHLIGGAAGFLSFLGVWGLFRLITKRDGLGGGDIKLAGACGLLLGWERLLLSVLLASVAACIVLPIVGAVKSKRGTKGDGEYPFAPFLSSAFGLALLFGNFVIHAYLSLLGL